VFGEGTYSFTDKLDVTAGVRYSRYEEERALTFDGVFAVPTIGVPGAVEDEDVAPRVIVSYKATDNLTVNAQAAKGFRLGGVNDPLNAPLCGADLATFQPLFKIGFANEEVWNYEVGLKSRLAGGRGSFTMAAYFSDIENLQATVDAGNCSSRIIVNVPSAKAQGVEAELAARLGDRFDFALAASCNEDELTSSVRDSSGNVLAALRDGNQLPTVPEVQFAASATYTQPLNNGLEGFATATFQHIGERYTQISDQENDPRTVTLIPIGAPTVTTQTFQLELPSYEIVNLRVGVKGDGWEGAVFLNNASNEIGRLAIDRERGLRARYSYLTNQPRTLGVTFCKSF
jgi:iron complex outermembrane receptor protein